MAFLLCALVLVTTLSCTRSAPAAEGASAEQVVGPDPDLGPPISAWYFSLRTSKGYCGLVPATAAAGGYGYVITCNNKLPQYAVQFTLLVPPLAGHDVATGGSSMADTTGVSGVPDTPVHKQQGSPQEGQQLGQEGISRVGEQDDGEQQGQGHELWGLQQQRQGRPQLGQGEWEISGAAGGGRQQGSSQLTATAARPNNATGAGVGAAEGLRIDPSDPIMLTSGRPVRLLMRNAGLCNTPALPPPPAGPLAADEAGGGGAPSFPAATRLLSAVSATARKVRAGVLRTATRLLSAGGGNTAADATDSTGRLEDHSLRPQSVSVSVSDLPPHPVTCSLGQPSELVFRVYKSDLKDGQDLDLGKEWVYLREGDKYCTLADVAGLSAAISCHLDAPGWTGYKFQMQPAAYPRAQLLSLLTGGPCGVLAPQLPGPHDVECWAWEQGQRVPQVDLVLQTPGVALSAGVVVGFSTFTGKVIGQENQRCCAAASSPHILLCEPPATAAPGTAVPGECWFQLYDVKLAAVQDDDANNRGKYVRGCLDGSTSSRSSRSRNSHTFWQSLLRALATEMSPAGLDPEFGFLDSGELGGLTGSSDGSEEGLDHGVLNGRQHSSSGSSSSDGIPDSKSSESVDSDSVWASGKAAGGVVVGVTVEKKQAGLDLADGWVRGAGGVASRVGRQNAGWRPDSLHPLDGEEEEEAEEEDEMEEEDDASLGDGAAAAGDMRLQQSTHDVSAEQRDQKAYGKSSAVRDDDKSNSVGSGGGGGSGRSGVFQWLQGLGWRQLVSLWGFFSPSPDVNYVMISRDGDEWPSVSASGGGDSDDDKPNAAAAGALGPVGARHARLSRGGGGGWFGGAAAALGDGSLVMMSSKAFGRYCSVSVDGTLLCVSAQASNASRNLFMLVMPPPSETGRKVRAATGEGQRAV